MRFGKKLIACLTVLMMLLGNGFTAMPTAYACSPRIQVTKQLASGQTDTTSQFQFKITRYEKKNGQWVQKESLKSPLITANSSYTFTGLTMNGYYTINEINIPSGYLDSPVFSSSAYVSRDGYRFIYVNDSGDDGLKLVTCTNTKTPPPVGSIKVTKNITGGTAATGDKFTFHLYQGSTLVDTQTITWPDTTCTFTKLPFGNYKVVEDTTTGYVTQSEFVSGYAVNVDCTQTKCITCTNAKTPPPVGSIKVTKNITGGTAATGDQFKFHLYQGSTLIDTQSITWPATTCTFGNLPFGSYKVVEDTTTDYVTQSEFVSGYAVNVDCTQTKCITCTNTKTPPPVGSIKVTKNITGGTAATGDKFTFHLYQGSTLIDTQSITWPDTTCTFGNLPFGSYTVVEDTTTGYVTQSEFVSGYAVNVDCTQTKCITCTNTKTPPPVGSIKVTKNITGGTAATGDQFTFHLYQGSTLIDTQSITWPATTCTFSNLPFGNYKVVEDTTTGYVTQSEFVSGYAVNVDCTQTKCITCTNTKTPPPVGSIKVTKNITGGAAATGDQFNFHLYQGSTLIDTQSITWPATTCTFSNLPFGNYKVVEDTTTGYVTQSEFVSGYAVNVDCTQTKCITCTNTKLGSITLSKAFKGIHTSTTDTFDVTITGINGTIYSRTVHLTADGAPQTYSDLPYGGTFQITEADVPGYHLVDISGTGLDANDQFKIISPLTSITVAVTNEQLGSANIKKTVPNYTGTMPDFQVRLKGVDGSTTVYDQAVAVPANSAVGVNVPNLPYGHYTITEEQAANSYYQNLSITPSTGFDINDTSKIAEINVINEARGSIKIVKLDSRSTEGNPIPVAGARFEVYYKSGGQNVYLTLQNDTTGQDGTLTIGGLAIGRTYYAHEIHTPDGYIPGGDTKEYVLSTPGQTATSDAFVNTPVGRVMAEKIDSVSGALLGGFSFGLYASQADAQSDSGRIETLTTSNTPGAGYGTAVSKELILTGATTSFWVEELPVAAGSGYKQDTVAHEAVIPYDGRLTPIIVKISDDPFFTVTIRKYDAATVINGNFDAASKLAGAVFDIFKDKDCTQQYGTDLTIGPSGSITVDLPFGGSNPATYYIKEVTPPPGYLLDKSAAPTPVTYAGSSQPGQVITLNFADVSDVGSVIIKKVDALDSTKVLAGAVFKLYSDAALTHQVGVAVTTNSKGLARFDNLEPGKYWAKETTAPDGYNLAKEITAVMVVAGLAEPSPVPVKDTPHDNIPTGTSDYDILLAGAGTLLAGALIVLLTRKKRMKAK